MHSITFVCAVPGSAPAGGRASAHRCSEATSLASGFWNRLRGPCADQFVQRRRPPQSPYVVFRRTRIGFRNGIWLDEFAGDLRKDDEAVLFGRHRPLQRRQVVARQRIATTLPLGRAKSGAPVVLGSLSLFSPALSFFWLVAAPRPRSSPIAASRSSNDRKGTCQTLRSLSQWAQGTSRSSSTTARENGVRTHKPASPTSRYGLSIGSNWKASRPFSSA